MTAPTLSLAPARGMRDFYPEDMVLRRRIFDAWQRAARLFGFEEYDACVVESLDLLKRKAGEEIGDQIYWFTDKSGRELALRPEMTPSLARMVAARQSALEFPLKWTTIAQCFRYERMTRGRKREHYQWNLDILGETGVTAEAEVIACALTALRDLGLGAGMVRVHYSNRALLADLLERAAIAREHHAAVFLALDKRGKVPPEAIAASLEEAGLNRAQADAALALCNIGSLADAVRMLGEETIACRNLRRLEECLEAGGFADALVFDISVIRGLAYYTGIVFEAFDVKREFRAIFGGGRYDNLLRTVGGQELTGVGLGFGDVVVGELLQERGLAGAAHHALDVAVAFMENEQRETAFRVAHAFRRAGKSVDLALAPMKPKPFFAKAAKWQAAEAVYIGPDDVRTGTIRIKNLANRSQREVPLAEI